jgi:hypothetical protein
VRPESGEGLAEYGEQRLTLAEEDADAIVLGLTPAVTVRGRLVADDPSVPLGRDMTVEARTVSDIGGFLGSDRAPVGADATFTLAHLAGERLLRVSGAAASRLVLKAVFRGTEDVTNVPVAFAANDSVRIVLSSHFARVEGTVTLDGVAPAVGRDVLLFSEDRRVWVKWSTAVQALRTDSRGHYASTAPVPPGRYYVVAVTAERSLPPNEVDPAILDALVRDATSIVVNEDEVRVADIRMSGGY